jgi:hypothetical protein
VVELVSAIRKGDVAIRIGSQMKNGLVVYLAIFLDLTIGHFDSKQLVIGCDPHQSKRPSMRSIRLFTANRMV